MKRTVLVLSSMTAGVIFACLATLMCALSGTLGARGVDAQAAAVCGPSWSSVASIPDLKDPRAIAAVTPDDVWIVGSKGLNAGGYPNTGAEHWDGAGWVLFPTPNGGTGENALNGADALSSDYVWAVGYYSNGGGEASAVTYRTLVERWDGTSWSVIPSPNPGTSSATLVGVEAVRSDLAWAVGNSWQDSLRKTLITRWDGTSWNVVPSPNPGTSSNALLDVASTGANDAWAVGYKNGGAGYRSLLSHYDGAGWKAVGVPHFGTADNVLTAVSAPSGTNVWASGYYVEGTRHKTLTLHYDGKVWERVPSANQGDDLAILRGIDASSPTDAWAVGGEYRADMKKYVASTQHWDGSAWTAFPSAIAETGANSEMLDVAKAPGTQQTWATGRFANVETICPSGDASATASSTAPVRATKAPTVSTISAPEQQSPTTTASRATSASSDQTASALAVRAVDEASDAGIREMTKTFGAVVTDFDNDGLPDIFLNRHQFPARLYHNDGNGHFTEIENGTFDHIDRHGCDAADVNNDGLKDIFCATGSAKGSLLKRDELYIQRPDHTFVDQAASYGVLEPYGRGRASKFVMANGDAYPDLFVTNARDRGDGMPTSNRLFVNRQGGSYRYSPKFGVDREVGGPGRTDALGAADLDKDGWQDLILRTLGSSLRFYHNDQGAGFTDTTGSVGLGQKAKGMALVDVDGDDWQDIVEVKPTQLSVWRNTSGTFSKSFSTALSYGSGVAAGDVNGDGLPDLYVMRGNDTAGTNAPDQVYLNDGTGESFSPMPSIPSTGEGEAESVFPIDHDSNGLTDFLVLNGAGKSQGPVELVSFYQS